MPHPLTAADKGRESQTQPPGSSFTFLPEQSFALRMRKKLVIRKLATFRDSSPQLPYKERKDPLGFQES